MDRYPRVRWRGSSSKRRAADFGRRNPWQARPTPWPLRHPAKWVANRPPYSAVKPNVTAVFWHNRRVVPRFYPYSACGHSAVMLYHHTVAGC